MDCYNIYQCSVPQAPDKGKTQRTASQTKWRRMDENLKYPEIAAPATETDRLENTADALPNPEAIAKDVVGEKGLIELSKNCLLLQASILQLQKEHPELLELTEEDHKNRIRKEKGMSLALIRLRAGLWMEYERAWANQQLMQFSRIYAGICTESVARAIIKNPSKLAFLVCPPNDYIVVLREAHSTGLNTIRDILEAKVFDDDGNLIPRAADVVIKAFALIDLRLKGAVVQRIDQRTISQNVSIVEHNHQGVTAPKSMEDLDRQIAEARAKLLAHSEKATVKQLESERQVIDIHSQDKNKDVVLMSKVYGDE